MLTVLNRPAEVMNQLNSQEEFNRQGRLLNCILLVDDDEPTNILHQLVWEEIGLVEHIQTASSGREALDYLIACRDRIGHHFILPDLILLDVNMPAMNGFEFLEAFRRLPGFHEEDIKVVLLTTSLLLEDYRQNYASLGITSYRNKPLTTELAMEIASETLR